MTVTNNAPKLSPCPCCGGNVDWYDAGRYQGVSTRCGSCKMVFMGYWSDSQLSYAKRFNARPGPPPPFPQAKVVEEGFDFVKVGQEGAEKVASALIASSADRSTHEIAGVTVVATLGKKEQGDARKALEE